MELLVFKLMIVSLVGLILKWFIPLFRQLDHDLLLKKISLRNYNGCRNYLVSGVSMLAFIAALALAI